MEFDFDSDELSNLYENPAATDPVVKAFRRRMSSIEAATDERDLRAPKGNHYEKLQGRDGEYSIRLNKQWRLVFRYESRDGVKTVVILRIEDYH